MCADLDKRIPFNQPTIVGKELYYISQAINGGHSSGDGKFTKMCNKILEDELGVPKVLLTTSCTHALEMCALLLNIQPGDEIICPAYTFVSTINAFVLRGGRPVFVDIRPDTLNIDENYLEEAITSRTKVILVVHYAGIGCEMDSIMEIASRYGLAVVEDNAHGLFGKYKKRYLGTIGSFATQSFHETKNISCGEGGALVIMDPKYIERAEIIREKGTNRSRYFRGQVDKYSWIDIGSSYLPSDILAAFLYAQLEARLKIQAKRKMIWEKYRGSLYSWAAINDIQMPYIPDHCEQPYHMFYLLLPGINERQALIEHLCQHNILGVFHYLPLHLSDMGRRFGGKEGDCPVTERISDQLIRLPFYYNLYPEDQDRVIDTLLDFKIR